MASVLDLVKHYQHAIEKYPNDEQKVLKCIDKLFNMGVTVQHLQETGVGRTVNALRKEPGDVGQAARSLVYKWKLMVAAEESDQETEQNNDTQTHNGHGSGKDSDDNAQSRNKSDRYERSNSTPKPQDHKEVNGNYSGSKRKYQSSEDDEDTKRIKQSSLSEDEYKKRTHSRDKKLESESDSYDESDNSQSDESDSQMSESSQEEIKVKQEIKKEHSSSHKSSSAHSSHNEHADHNSSSLKKTYESEKHSRHESSQLQERHSSDKTSSKEKSHSSDKHKSLKEKESNSEKKHKTDYKSDSEKNHRESKSSTRHSSSDKHNSSDRHSSSQKHSSSDKHASSDKHRSSSSHKSDSGSDKNKITSDKHSKSEKHKTSSHSKAPEKEKHKSSSENEIYKNKATENVNSDSSSKEKHSSSSKEKSKDRSSSSKEKTSSHSSEKKHSSSSDNKSSNSNRKGNSDNKDEKSSDNKKSKHKSSSSTHKSSKSSSNKKEDVPKKKVQIQVGEDSDDGIDCGSGASFAEALGMISPAKSKKKQLKDATSPNYDLSPAAMLAPSAKLAPLPTIEISALPEISPNYKPRPPPKALPHFSDEDAMSASISSKNQRTKVYSGNKVIGKIPTLYEICVNVLQEHIDALEYTGGVPYDILKPVIDRASPRQLFLLEHYNPYLMEDTDHLWQNFCVKHFRNKQRQEMEAWREMYTRCQEEQEIRLKSLTANIKIAQEAKKAPIKQTKMAYVDSVAKPPRNIAKKQAQHGTARLATASPAARVASLASQPNVLRGGATARPLITAPSTTSSSLKPKKAPLMAKALQIMRGRKR